MDLETVIARVQIALASSACLAAMAGAPAAAQSFNGLGALPGAGEPGRALAVSGDGSIVVGYIDQQPIPYREAFRWTASGGLESLGFLPGALDSNANAISADGSTIVGDSNGQAFRWTADGGMESLGPGEALDVSGDGSVVVGMTSSGDAFRWTQGAGVIALGDLPGAVTAQAKGVSDDGEILAGVAYVPSSSMFFPYRQQAFRWTAASGVVSLGSLVSGDFGSDAYDVSGDGRVIVGAAENGSTWEAFRWTEADGMVGLGTAGAYDSYAYATSFNGAVIVGKAGNHATVWTEADGMRYVADILTANGVDLTGWDLESADGVSANGEILVGAGHNPSGDVLPWIAHLDLGLVTFDDLALSLSSVVGVGQSAQQVESAHLGGLMDLVGTYGPPDSVGSWSAWGGVSVAHYNILEIDPEARQGDLGFAYQLTRAWRLGAGVRWGGRDDDVLVFDGENDSDYAGVSLFAAFEPSPHGLRLHTTFAANWIENDIRRGYLNGSALTSSSGEQDGLAYGAALRVGWAAPLSERVVATPFVAYEVSRIALDGYTETTGPFPAQFNDADARLDVARAGAQLDLHASDAWRVWVMGDYAMRRQSDLPEVSGEVIALASPFAIEGAEMNRQWWETTLGAEWRASRRTRLQLSVHGSSDGDTAAHHGARVSAIVTL